MDSSWIWIAVLAVSTLWGRFDARFPGIGSGSALAYAVLGAILFFGSVFLHELAHAISARLSGIRVEGITLVFFGGFTAARSDEKGPGPAFVIAALGPGTSLAIGAGLRWLSGVAEAPGEPFPLLLGYVGLINLFMAGFNVLPGLPLDGGRMLQAAVWRVTGNRTLGTRVAAGTGMAVGVLLFAAAIWTATRGDAGQRNLFESIWLAVIGLFIFQGARASGRHVDLVDRLAARTVAEVMEPPPPAVPADLSLSETLERYLRGHEEEAFPVIELGGRVIGMISFSSARDLGARDPLRRAREALIPLEHVLIVHPDDRLDVVSTQLGSGRAALVLRDGLLVGAISRVDVSRWARPG